MAKLKGKAKKLIISICEEHGLLSSKNRGISYLWGLYSKNSNYGDFNIVIAIADLRLNVIMNVITQSEMDNIVKMINSSDEASFYIGILAVGEFRKQRHKQYGAARNNTNYASISENYESLVLSYAITQK